MMVKIARALAALIDPLPAELQRMKRVAIRDAAELKRVMIVGNTTPA
jgi:hypothetical protein